jgi:hypothetical protein
VGPCQKSEDTHAFAMTIEGASARRERLFYSSIFPPIVEWNVENDSVSPPSSSTSDHNEARRRFPVQCGRYAAITPPAVTVLLSVTQSRYATAASGVSPRSDGTTFLSGGGSFPLPSDGTCAQAQGVFVGDSPGCVRLRSQVDFRR